MIIKKYIAYLGVEKTTTESLINIEIAGLRHAIAVAQERIANLEQSLVIAEFQIKDMELVEQNDEKRDRKEID